MLDRNRQPISGAEVHLRDIDQGNFIGQTATSAGDGTATISNVPPGRYDIGAYKIDNAVPGYNQWIFSPNSAGYLVAPGQTVGPIEIVLDKTDTHMGGVQGFCRYQDAAGTHPIGVGVHIDFYNGGHLESSTDSDPNGHYSQNNFNCINIDGAHPNWGWHTYIATWTDAGGVQHKALGRNFGTWPGVPIRMDIVFYFPSWLQDRPAPAWAERVILTDTVSAGASGPSAADSVNLASGVYENKPDPDLVVRNPVGPSPLFARRYHSLEASKGRATPGLSIGWKHNYDVTIQASFPGTWGPLTLSYPNGAQETIGVNGNPPTSLTAPNGAPYFVSGNASGTSGQWNSLTLTFKDQSSWTFTPDPSNPNNYQLTRIANLVGNLPQATHGFIQLNYDSSNRLISVVDDGANLLLTLAYDPTSHYLTSISDVPGGRTVLYQFGTMPDSSLGLTVVSQINKPLTSLRWQYAYQLVNGVVFLASASVPNPTGGAGTTGNSIGFNSQGQCTILTDANGNTRYHNFNSNTLVQVVGTDGTVESWQQTFGSLDRDTGQIDANGKSSTLYYDDANNKYRETRVVNKNTQTTTLAYDAGATTYVGNLTSITVPTSTGGTLTTTYTYGRYDLSPLGLLTSVQEGSKTPTQFTYYDGTTTVDDVLQPRGLLQSIISPMPGSTTGQTVTTTYSYTALGNIAKIVSPAPNGTLGATVSTLFEYRNDPTIGYTNKPEALDEPVMITDPNGHATHVHYNARHLVDYVVDAMLNETDYQYDDANRLTRITYPATGQSGPGHAFASITYNYTNGAPLNIQYFNESGNGLPTATTILGVEGESQGQTGALQDLTLQRDRQYRLAKMINGKNEARTYGYDSVGNLSSLTYPGVDSVRITAFDNDGNPTQRTDGRGLVTNFTRSLNDASITEIHHVTDPGHDQYFTYDQYGRVTKIQHGADLSHLIDTIEYIYDDLDNILSVKTTYQDGNSNPIFTTNPTQEISYGYFPDGSRSQMGTPAGTFFYTYDNAGNLTRVSCPWTGGGLTYDYDALNHITHQRHAKADTFYEFNQRSFMTSLSNKSTWVGAPPLSSFTNMIYDAVGNLTQASVSLPPQGFLNQDFSGTVFYFYDNKNRLTEEKRRLSDTQLLYDYFLTPDGADNRTTARSVVFAFNTNDQITSDSGGAQYIYDGNGNPTTYMSNGIVYDFENRPTQITNYVYMDWRGDGRRAWKQGSGGVPKEYFLYDGDRVICELGPTGSLLRAYGYGANGLMQRFIQGVGYRGYTFDPFGHIVNRLTADSTNGKVEDNVIYDSAGQLYGDFSTTGGAYAVNDPLGPGAQAGVYTDEETRTTQTTGLALVLSGYYDARATRYLSRGSEGGNVYAGDRSFFSWHTAGSVLAGIGGFIVGGPLGSAIAVGGYETLFSLAEGRSAGESVLNGVVAGVKTYAFGKAFDAVGSWVSQTKAFQGLLSPFKNIRGACFVAGTPVQVLPHEEAYTQLRNLASDNGNPDRMSLAATKPIEQVKSGEMVASRDPKTGHTEYKRVVRTSVRRVGSVLKLQLADVKTGKTVETITATANHPFYVERRGFVPAGGLAVGNAIVTRAGPALKVQSVESLKRQEGFTVYNFEVEDDYTYFVGHTNGGAWVHNGPPCSATQTFQVGSYEELAKGAKGLDLEIHHLPQAHLAEQVIPGYTRETGLAIALPARIHRGLSAASRLRGNLGGISSHEVRLLISRQLRDLVNADVPKDTMRELGQAMKGAYPSIYE